MIDLSVVQIFREEDARYMEQCHESLPDGVELCLVQTIEGASPTTSDFRMMREETMPNGTVVRKAVYVYPRGGFRFDVARNRALSLARRKWCLALDADERLVEHQHHDWQQITEELSDSVGAVHVAVWGSMPHRHGLSLHNTAQPRLFRNDPGIYFRKAVHEFFGLSEVVRERGMDIIDSTLGIHHVGYEVGREEILHKCRRNLRGMYRELARDPDQPDLEAKLYDTIALKRDTIAHE